MKIRKSPMIAALVLAALTFPTTSAVAEAEAPAPVPAVLATAAPTSEATPAPEPASASTASGASEVAAEPTLSASVSQDPVPGQSASPAPVLSPMPTGTPEPATPVIVSGSVAVEGAPASGRPIRAVVSGWETGVALSYQWLRNGTAVVGATSPSYTVTAADAGARLSVVVTGTRAGSDPVQVISDPAVVPSQLTGSTPVVSGRAVQGQSLSAVAGAWPTGTALGYQWLRNGAPIAGATGAKYVLAAADAGQKITVRVTGVLAGYLDAVKTSAPVLVLRVMSAPVPALAGTVKVGSALVARPGAWGSGVSLGYQWLRNGAPVRGAVGSSYRLGTGDAGQRIAVRVAGVKAGYAPASGVSAGVVVPRVLQASIPSYTGQALLGAVLQARTGTWSAGTAFRYQWYRNGAAIPGETRSSHRLGSADLGKRLVLRVSGAKAGYAPESRLSGLSGVIRRPDPVYYSQMDPRWAGLQVGAGLLGPSGCVPTATAMALWSEGVKVSPYSVAVTMNRVGDYNHFLSGAGSQSIVAAARYYGVKAVPITSSAALHAALRAGHTVVALMRGPDTITWAGTTHAVTLSGFTNDGSTFVRNPSGGAFNRWFDIDTLWYWQSFDAFDRNAGAVFWQIG